MSGRKFLDLNVYLNDYLDKLINERTKSRTLINLNKILDFVHRYQEIRKEKKSEKIKKYDLINEDTKNNVNYKKIL